jgi:hypothetical protein
MRVLAIDDVDEFISNEQREKEFNQFHKFIKTHLKQNVQYLFFASLFNNSIS